MRSRAELMRPHDTGLRDADSASGASSLPDYQHLCGVWVWVTAPHLFVITLLFSGTIVDANSDIAIIASIQVQDIDFLWVSHLPHPIYFRHA